MNTTVWTSFEQAEEVCKLALSAFFWWRDFEQWDGAFT
jgi:hypothetical protein